MPTAWVWLAPRSVCCAACSWCGIPPMRRRRIPADYEYKFIDFVNPEILAVSEDEETAYEGCLSFPGHNGAVTRPAAVKVRAQDRNGNWFELEADGLLGRCIQHENDHLDGVTIMESSEFSMRTPMRAVLRQPRGKGSSK